MSASPIGAVANYLMPYWQGQSSLLGQSQSGISSYAPTPAASSQTGDPVSLSDAGRALSAQQSTAGSSGTVQAGSSDFSQEAQLLGGLADKALAAMGVISVADEANAKVSFDALSYQVSSSTSASVSASQSQQGGQVTAQYGQQQDAVFAGEGHIVTADGRSIEFQIQLQLDQSQQISQSGSTAASNAANTSNAANAANAANATNATDSSGGLSSLLAQLFGTNSSGNASSANTSSAGATQATAGSSADAINWDAILNQSKSLIDLLDSLAGAGQAAAGSSAAATAAGTAASSATAASTVH
jgi:hypothetical protein